MPLQPFEIEPAKTALPAAVVALIADAEQRIDGYFDRLGSRGRLGFFPSDYELGYRTMRALRAVDRDARRLLEWGSGFGVVAGLASLAGFEAHGIEVDGELVAASRRLLADHGLPACIEHGSFVPQAWADAETISDLDTITVLGGADAYADMDLAIDDFDVVFAYPWPTEQELFCDLFASCADYGAVLVTYSMTEGMRAYRKVAGRGRNRRG